MCALVLKLRCEICEAFVGVDKSGKDGKIVAVYDLGGGTFDVSILEMNGGVFEVKSTNGNSSLGGEDIDKRIVEYLAQLFQQQTSIDISQDKLALQRSNNITHKPTHALS